MVMVVSLLSRADFKMKGYEHKFRYNQTRNHAHKLHEVRLFSTLILAVIQFGELCPTWLVRHNSPDLAAVASFQTQQKFLVLSSEGEDFDFTMTQAVYCRR